MRRYLLVLLCAGATISLASCKPSEKYSQSFTTSREKRIIITCDQTCNAGELAELPKIADDLIATEASPCFADFFLKANIQDPDNNSPAKIISDLTTQQVTSGLTIYYWPPWGPVEGFETVPNDGKVHAHEKFYKGWSHKLKASLIGHELSHMLGYRHIGNEAAYYNERASFSSKRHS